ncbi:hypothetical protein [Coxiella endosymbiont of Ornithodoros maritimus]|uniref:hypothetical protein n=1 Tax=Coxiella endosymbiont of Ornithodoros maritimus TaxID=1656172 RepID=UPI002263E5AD|nr:hypothetical protein [Coxiella endosymbiont of Ornithodoros maritimus]
MADDIVGEFMVPTDSKENLKSWWKFKESLERFVFLLCRYGDRDFGHEGVKSFVNSINDDLNCLNCCGFGKLGELNDIQRIIDRLLFDDSATLSFTEELQKS